MIVVVIQRHKIKLRCFVIVMTKCIQLIAWTDIAVGAFPETLEQI